MLRELGAVGEVGEVSPSYRVRGRFVPPLSASCIYGYSRAKPRCLLHVTLAICT